MNTNATQHPPSAIEILSDVLIHAHDSASRTHDEIDEAITSIWLPVFRSEQNFAMALDVLKISHDSVNAREMCERYLEVMRGMK